MIRAGSMRHKLALYRNHPIKSNTGAIINSWIKVKNIRGSINPVTGTEQFINDQIRNQISHKIGVRYDIITPNMKLIHDDREFDIVQSLDFQEKKVNLILLANERLREDFEIDYLYYDGEVVTHNGTKVREMELFDILTYDSKKVIDVLDIPDVYFPVVSVVTPVRERGKYELKYAVAYNFDSVTTSVLSRFKLNDGEWKLLSIEPTDKIDTDTLDYFFPVDLEQGINTFQFEMAKETAAGTLNVPFADLVIQRVGVFQ